MNEVYHAFALHLHEFVDGARPISVISLHQLVLGLVRAECYLGRAQDLVVQVVETLYMHEQLVLLDELSGLLAAEAKSLRIVQQGIRLLSESVLFAKHLALVEEHDVSDLVTKIAYYSALPAILFRVRLYEALEFLLAFQQRQHAVHVVVAAVVLLDLCVGEPVRLLLLRLLGERCLVYILVIHK